MENQDLKHISSKTLIMLSQNNQISKIKFSFGFYYLIFWGCIFIFSVLFIFINTYFHQYLKNSSDEIFIQIDDQTSLFPVHDDVLELKTHKFHQIKTF